MRSALIKGVLVKESDRGVWTREMTKTHPPTFFPTLRTIFDVLFHPRRGGYRDLTASFDNSVRASGGEYSVPLRNNLYC